jgi:hypothetical protein
MAGSPALERLSSPRESGRRAQTIFQETPVLASTDRRDGGGRAAARERRGGGSPAMSAERLRRSPGLELNEVEDGLIVYQESTERLHHLNPTAAIVFELCDGSHDAASIATIVGELFALGRAPADVVSACIARLVNEGLVR